MNNLDIYVYLTLYYQNLDSAFSNFLQLLSPKLWVPNVFTYFINQDSGNQLNSMFNNFGNEANLLMINSGSTLGILVVLLIVPVISLCTRKIRLEWLQRHIAKILNWYKYAVIVRFFLQYFLELSVNSAVGMYYTSFANVTQIVDFILCLVTAVLDI